MKFKEWIKNVFSFLGKVVNAADKAIKKLAPEVKEAFAKGSTILDVINTNVNNTPDEVYAIIQQKFPDFTREKVTEIMQKLTQGYNITGLQDVDDLTELISVIQGHLSRIRNYDGSFWAKLSSLGAKIVAQFLAPEGTKSSLFELLMDTFYHNYVKKN